MPHLLSLLHLLPLLLLLPLTLAAPLTTLSSPNNIYLSTCDPTTLLPRRTLLLLYPGPPSTTAPSLLATVSATGAHWEGTRRTADLGDAGTFVSDIVAGAEEFRKGEIAGQAQVGAEAYVCFREGGVVFEVGVGVGGGGSQRCVAEYWCGAV